MRSSRSRESGEQCPPPVPPVYPSMDPGISCYYSTSNSNNPSLMSTPLPLGPVMIPTTAFDPISYNPFLLGPTPPLQHCLPLLPPVTTPFMTIGTSIPNMGFSYPGLSFPCPSMMFSTPSVVTQHPGQHPSDINGGPGPAEPFVNLTPTPQQHDDHPVSCSIFWA